MKITIVTFLFAKRDMEVDGGHYLVTILDTKLPLISTTPLLRGQNPNSAFVSTPNRCGLTRIDSAD